MDRKGQPITRVWQKWRFSAPQTHFWLIKVWFSASTFVVKIATFAKAPCAGPEQVIEYLGRYTHKVVISNYRILENDTLNGTVTFRYKDYADENATKLMTLTGKEFVRRFEQHILPKQFTKIRSYGYLSNRGRTERLGLITEAMHIPSHPPKVKTPWPIRLYEKFGIRGATCPHCKRRALN